MYGIQFDGIVRLRTNEDLRAFARLEYPRESLHWVLAATRRAPKPRRPRNRLRLFVPRPRPATGPVACKGTPRRTPEAVPSPG